MGKQSKVYRLIGLAAFALSIYGIYHVNHSRNDAAEPTASISNARIVMEQAICDSQPFVDRVLNIVSRDSLSVEERAQLLADSVPAADIESMAEKWRTLELNGKSELLIGCLSEKTDVPTLDEYWQIFSKWKKIQPDNEFLEVLGVE